MPNITKARTITYDGEEVYVRTHIDVVDGLDKSMLLTPELIEKLMILMEVIFLIH